MSFTLFLYLLITVLLYICVFADILDKACFSKITVQDLLGWLFEVLLVPFWPIFGLCCIFYKLLPKSTL
jgi:hypothetical protein